VLTFALALWGGGRLKQRSIAFGLLAKYHASQVQELLDTNLPDPNWEENWHTGKSSLSPTEIADFLRSRDNKTKHHTSMHYKYKHAESRPWLWVTADPPPSG